MYPLSQYHVASCGLRIRHELFLSKSFVICFLSPFIVLLILHILYYLALQIPFLYTWTFLLLESS